MSHRILSAAMREPHEVSCSIGTVLLMMEQLSLFCVPTRFGRRERLGLQHDRTQLQMGRYLEQMMYDPN